jgi:hypothetical protein
MGLVNFGVPEKETGFLQKSMGLDVFVEGGIKVGVLGLLKGKIK